MPVWLIHDRNVPACFWTVILSDVCQHGLVQIDALRGEELETAAVISEKVFVSVINAAAQLTGGTAAGSNAGPQEKAVNSL